MIDIIPPCDGGEIKVAYQVETLDTAFSTLDDAKTAARKLVTEPGELIRISTVDYCADTGEIVFIVGNDYGIGRGLPE